MNASETLKRYPVSNPKHWGMVITACNLIGRGHHDATFLSEYRGAQHVVYGWRLRNGEVVTLDPKRENGELGSQIRAAGLSHLR